MEYVDGKQNRARLNAYFRHSFLRMRACDRIGSESSVHFSIGSAGCSPNIHRFQSSALHAGHDGSVEVKSSTARTQPMAFHDSTAA